LGDRISENRAEHGRGPEALVERAHDRALAAEAYEIGADDRGDDAGAANAERQAHQAEQIARAGHQKRDQDHRRTDGYDIGFEQVCGHSGAVTDIVADVVGDHGRVARIILGDSGLDLANQVGANVRGLGENSAAETREDRNQRRAEGKSDERVDHLAVVGREALHADEEVKEDGDRKQRKAGDKHAGDGARTEGEGEAALQARPSRFGCTDVGADRNVHSDITGAAGQDRAEHEADRLNMPHQEEDQGGDGDPDDADRRVLPAKIGLGALLDGCRDLDHARITRRSAEHLTAGEDTVEKRDNAAGDREKSQSHAVDSPLFAANLGAWRGWRRREVRAPL